jgi:general secretion pathway protein G
MINTNRHLQRTTQTRIGLTLIELMLSVTIIAILAGVAIPVAEKTLLHSKEARLHRNLDEVRSAIDRYYQASHRKDPQVPEWQKYPTTLQSLVEQKYLRQIPVDPFTGTRDYKLVYYRDVPEPAGVFSLHSRHRKLSERGDLYSSW